MRSFGDHQRNNLYSNDQTDFMFMTLYLYRKQNKILLLLDTYFHCFKYGIVPPDCA